MFYRKTPMAPVVASFGFNSRIKEVNATKMMWVWRQTLLKLKKKTILTFFLCIFSQFEPLPTISKCVQKLPKIFLLNCIHVNFLLFLLFHFITNLVFYISKYLCRGYRIFWVPLQKSRYRDLEADLPLIELYQLNRRENWIVTLEKKTS